MTMFRMYGVAAFAFAAFVGGCSSGGPAGPTGPTASNPDATPSSPDTPTPATAMCLADCGGPEMDYSPSVSKCIIPCSGEYSCRGEDDHGKILSGHYIPSLREENGKCILVFKELKEIVQSKEPGICGGYVESYGSWRVLRDYEGPVLDFKMTVNGLGMHLECRCTLGCGDG